MRSRSERLPLPEAIPSTTLPPAGGKRMPPLAAEAAADIEPVASTERLAFEEVAWLLRNAYGQEEMPQPVKEEQSFWSPWAHGTDDCVEAQRVLKYLLGRRDALTKLTQALGREDASLQEEVAKSRQRLAQAKMERAKPGGFWSFAATPFQTTCPCHEGGSPIEIIDLSRGDPIERRTDENELSYPRATQALEDPSGLRAESQYRKAIAVQDDVMYIQGLDDVGVYVGGADVHHGHQPPPPAYLSAPKLSKFRLVNGVLRLLSNSHSSSLTAFTLAAWHIEYRRRQWERNTGKPYGWKAFVDDGNGTLYYWNSITGETTWAKPTLSSQPESGLPTAPPPVKAAPPPATTAPLPAKAAPPPAAAYPYVPPPATTVASPAPAHPDAAPHAISDDESNAGEPALTPPDGPHGAAQAPPQATPQAKPQATPQAPPLRTSTKPDVSAASQLPAEKVEPQPGSPSSSGAKGGEVGAAVAGVEVVSPSSMPKAGGTSPGSQSGGRLTVVINKEPGQVLGLQVGKARDTNSMLIVGVQPGIVRTWSDLHPETPIEPGSTLYSVNTIRGFQAMQDELRKARQLVLVVIPPQRKG